MQLYRDSKEVENLRTTSDLDSTALDHVIESPVPRDLLRHTVMCNPEFERQMSAVAQNIGIAFPARLLENFISVYSLLKSNLPENMSALLATTGTLMPWVLRVRGEGVARVFEEATKVMFGKA